ncbi:MAG: type II toxin-antitoxin system HicB family antitoxin [Chloroflexota bacterium]|nr:type II toxin-antitoxin system HicB family antitoxin [Chloroflexota bacterium]
MNYYPTIVYYTEEDGGYFAVVPDLPGCTAHGETPEEALREAQIAQELWLEAVRDRGWPVPEPSRYLALRAVG